MNVSFMGFLSQDFAVRDVFNLFFGFLVFAPISHILLKIRSSPGERSFEG